jgi:hypothetical protein
MTETAAPLPVELERELNILGVRRAFSLPAEKVEADWSFKRPVLDEFGNPEF